MKMYIIFHKTTYYMCIKTYNRDTKKNKAKENEKKKLLNIPWEVIRLAQVY